MGTTGTNKALWPSVLRKIGVAILVCTEGPLKLHAFFWETRFHPDRLHIVEGCVKKGPSDFAASDNKKASYHCVWYDAANVILFEGSFEGDYSESHIHYM
jgi:hypothetical protein